MTTPVIVLGAGGHARVLVEALARLGIEVLGLTDADPARAGSALGSLLVLGDDAVVLRHTPHDVRLVNGLGSAGSTAQRTRIFEHFRGLGYFFETVAHPSSIVAYDVILGHGAQLMAGCVVQPGSRIGDNAIINTNASVDHDCNIGAHVHVSPGATISGGVRIDVGVHVGAGATIIQGVNIGARSIVGAGAVVLDDIPSGVTVAGAPAKELHI